MADIKWSAFPDGSAITSGDEVVGLRSGVNVRLTANAFDNLELSGNEITATNAGGNITLIPDGTGNVDIFAPPASESSSITVNGFPFNAAFRVNDIGTVAPAQSIIHRHSTTLEPVLLYARANSDTDAHVAVTNGMALSSTYSSGWTGAQYSLFGQIRVSADSTGTINNTSAPGKIDLLVTPDGSITPATAFTITNDKTATFAGNVTVSSGVVDITGQLDVDNVRVDGNTISSTDTNGTVNIVPNGTGNILLKTSTAISGFSNSIINAPAGTGGSFVNCAFIANNTGALYYAIKSRNTTVNGHTAINASDDLSNHYAFGDDGTNYTAATLIRSNADGAISTGIIPGKITFYTATSGGTLTVAASIDSSQATTFSGLVIPSQTIGIKGTTTNNNAQAGSIGEYIESIVLSSSPVALTNNTAANITSISLTAGDWDVFGCWKMTVAASTNSTNRQGGISTTSATLPTSVYISKETYTIVGSADGGQAVPTRRLSLSGTTTVYLVAFSSFTVSTSSAWGFIGARRVR